MSRNAPPTISLPRCALISNSPGGGLFKAVAVIGCDAASRTNHHSASVLTTLSTSLRGRLILSKSLMMTLASAIEVPTERIAEICTRCGIRELAIFGSAARGTCARIPT
jgi:hypothetical protein